MNICGNGICVCQGGSDVIGEDSSCADSRRDIIGETKAFLANWNPRYYFDSAYGVVLSVQPNEMISGVRYYYDPDLTNPI